MAERNFILSLLIKAKDQALPTVRKLGRGIDTALSAPRRTVTALKDSFFNLRNGIIGAVTAAGLWKSIDIEASMEVLQTRVRAATDSAEEFTAAWAQISELGNSSEIPLTTQQVADAFIRLKNLGLDPSREALLSYGNTAAAMGKQLDEFIEAVADAATNEFERLKEFGIKARQQGDQVVFTFQGVETAVRKDAAAIEGYLQGIGNVQFAGQLEAQAKTARGLWQNLMKFLRQGVDDLVSGGLFDKIKEGLQDVQLLIEYAVKTGKAKEWGDQIGQAVLSIGSHVQTAGKVFNFLIGGVRLAINGLSAAFNATAGLVSGFLAGVVEASAEALEFFGADAWAAEARRVSESLSNVSKDYLDNLREDSRDISSSVNQMSEAMKKSETVFTEFMGTAREWKKSAKENIEQPTDDAAGSMTRLERSLTSARDVLNDIKNEKIRIDVDSRGVTEYSDGLTGVNIKQRKTAESADEMADKTKKSNEATSEAVDITKMSVDEYVHYRQSRRDASKATKEGTQATEQNTEAQEEGNDAMAAAGSLAAVMAQHMAGLRDEMESLSEGALVAFDAAISAAGERLSWATDATRNLSVEMPRMASEAEKTAAEIEGVEQDIASLTKRLREGHTEVGNWFIQTELAAARVKIAYLEAKQSAEAMLDRLDDLDTASESVIRRAQGMANSYTLLDQQTLDNLQREVDRLTAANERAADSAADALRRYQDLIDRQQGNEVAIAERERAEALKDLEEQLAEVRKTGNRDAIRDLEQALQKAREYHTEEIRRLKERLAKEKEITEEKERQAETEQPPGATSGGPLSREPVEEPPPGATAGGPLSREPATAPPPGVTTAFGSSIAPTRFEDEDLRRLGRTLFEAVTQGMASVPIQIDGRDLNETYARLVKLSS